MGIFSTLFSMRLENFCLVLYDNRPFVEKVLDHYCDWTTAVAERICQLEFDIFITPDDMAFNTGPFLTAEVFREIVLPRYQRLGDKITSLGSSTAMET